MSISQAEGSQCWAGVSPPTGITTHNLYAVLAGAHTRTRSDCKCSRRAAAVSDTLLSWSYSALSSALPQSKSSNAARKDGEWHQRRKLKHRATTKTTLITEPQCSSITCLRRRSLSSFQLSITAHLDSSERSGALQTTSYNFTYVYTRKRKVFSDMQEFLFISFARLLQLLITHQALI